MSALSPVVIVYHYPCPDGAFAALAARLYFNKTNIQEQQVDYLPQPVYEILDLNNPLFTSDSVVYLCVHFYVIK
jgi:hypothetical protein